MNGQYLEIPDEGTGFAVYRDRVIYGKYQKSGTDTVVLADGTLVSLSAVSCYPDLLELHLFDRNREYRCVRTRQRGVLESLIDDERAFAEYEDSYIEEIYILEKDADQKEELRQKVGVVNYIRYNADDLAVIDQYRLKEVE